MVRRSLLPSGRVLDQMVPTRSTLDAKRAVAFVGHAVYPGFFDPDSRSKNWRQSSSRSRDVQQASLAHGFGEPFDRIDRALAQIPVPLVRAPAAVVFPPGVQVRLQRVRGAYLGYCVRPLGATRSFRMLARCGAIRVPGPSPGRSEPAPHKHNHCRPTSASPGHGASPCEASPPSRSLRAANARASHTPHGR